VKKPHKGFHHFSHSNTGYTGVTETYTTRRGVRYPCFTVSARPRMGKVKSTKFYFSGEGTRSAALAHAIKWREDILANRHA
jgi:hypothetical protein